MAEDEYTPILNDELLSWIGRENEPETAEVTLAEIQRYANAVALSGQNPLYFDEEQAKPSAYGSLIAPFQFYSVPFSEMAETDTLGGDGLPRSGSGNSLRPPIPLPRTMAGGSEVEYIRPIRPGDRLTRRSKLTDMTERQGRTGPLVFTTIETTYRDEKDQPVVIVRSTSISR